MYKFLTIKTNTIILSAAVIGFFTIMAQILALVRNKVFATEFGASEILDIYNTAFQIPDIIFLFIGMMVSASILIPFLEEKDQKNSKKYQEFISKILTSFFLLLIFASALFFLLIPFLINFLFPGFQGESQEQLITLSRIMLLSPIFMGIANIFISINQKNSSFVPVALTGVFYNISIIFSVYFFYPIFGINGLAYGVVLGAIIFLLLQLPSIFQHKLFPQKINFLTKKEFLKYFSASLPRSFALFMMTLIVIFLYSQASKMTAGSITMLQFALSLYFIPIALITTSYSIASFPKLAKFFAEKNTFKFSRIVSLIFSQTLFFLIPISLFFMFFSQEITGFLFGSAKFDIVNINTTALIISIFSIIIIIQSLNIIFARILYAIRNVQITLISNIIALFSIIIIFYFSQIFWNNSLILLALLFLGGNILSLFYFFIFAKIKMKKYLDLKNVFIFKKIVISLSAIILTRIIIGLPDLINQERFFDYFQTLFFSGLIFVTLFIIFSEIFQEKTYLYFKEKLQQLLKKFF